MVLFPLPTKATPTDEWVSPTRIVRFGDGYEDRSPDGLNRPRESWNVEVFYASEAAAQTLKDFLLEHGQHEPFQWKPPRDASVAQNYVITGAVSGATRRGGGSKPWFWTRSMRFDRWYGVVSVPDPLNIIQGTTGDDPNLLGTSGNDTIYGNGGNDSISGLGGDDTIYAGNPSNSANAFSEMYGGGGNDTVIGGSEFNILNGTGDGWMGVGEEDVLVGGSGPNGFILGGVIGCYYLGSGHATIFKFDPTKDFIQLANTSADYTITYSGNDATIKLLNGDTVGIIKNAPPGLILTAGYFFYPGEQQY